MSFLLTFPELHNLDKTLTWFELQILSWNLQLTLCSWNMQEYLSWLCPTTVLASESWLVLLVRIGGSELVTDSVSLFWKPKWKKGRKKLEEQGTAAETHRAVNRQNLNSTRHSQQVQTQSPPTNLGSRGDTEATICTHLGFLLLGIHHLGALLLYSFGACRTDMIISTPSFIRAKPSSCLTESRLAQNQHSTPTLTPRPSKVPKLLHPQWVTRVTQQSIQYNANSCSRTDFWIKGWTLQAACS